MPGDESYFLLTTFANMALARTEQDYDFVKTTTIDLFQVCIIIVYIIYHFLIFKNNDNYRLDFLVKKHKILVQKMLDLFCQI